MISKRDAVLRERILAIIPRHGFVAAADVVRTLRLAPQLVWPHLFALAADGIITTQRSAKRGITDEPVMLKRLL